jgi:hypothetical protein
MMVASDPTALRTAGSHYRARLVAGMRTNGAFAVDAVFIGFLFLVADLRWRVIDSYPEPSGVDGGDWLAIGHSLLGSHSLVATNVYPPLTPLLAVGFAAIWGPLAGAKIVALVSSLAPAAGAYVALRSQLGLRAALIAGLLAPAAATGEAAAWGGYPQLLALGLLPLLLWAIDHALERRTLRWALICAIFLFLIVATNELVGAIGIAASFIVLLVRVVVAPQLRRPSMRQLTTGVLVSVLPLAALAPIYLILATGFVHNDAIPGSNQHIDAENFLSAFNNTFKDNVGLWSTLALVALASPILLLRRGRAAKRRTALAVSSAALIAPTVGILLLFGNVRFLDLLPTAIALAMGAWWLVLSNKTASFVAHNMDRVLIPTICLVLAVESALGLALFDSQVRWYSALSPRVVDGLQQLDRIAPKGAVLSVGPAPSEVQDGRPWGWWVEGLLDRPTYYSSSLIWIDLPADRQRVVIANQMFDPAFGVARAITLAKASGIDYIVVATAWPGYRAWISNGSIYGSRVVVDTESVLIISTSG